MGGRLRTFCHISEYDEVGYRNLHRLIAASDPLVLWAPSSQIVSDPDVCRVSPSVFLDFVEEGTVQVVAREPWLDSPAFRDGHGWPGARWDKTIDEALRRMFRDDQRVPDLRQRRVVAAAEETGPDRAHEAIEKEPGIAAEIVEALSDGERKAEIPPGTLATATRSADDAFSRAAIVLRDAYNHADAITLSEAETAILLSPGDGVFSRRVAAIFSERLRDEPGRLGGSPDATSILTAAELSRQLVELLATLESLGPPADLPAFMRGRGREELIAWSRAAIDLLVDVRPARLKDEMARKLRDEIEAGAFASAPFDLRFASGASLALAAIGLLEEPTPLTLFGLAFAAHPVLRAAAEAHDLASAEFSGPRWPFRYVWGTGPRRGQHARLLDLFEAPGDFEDGV